MCRLAVAGGHPVPAGQLAEDLWEGRPGPGTPATLQSHVSHLRRLLGPGWLVYRESGYALDLGAVEIDAVTFDRETQAGLHQLAVGDPAGATGLLVSALGRWRGPALADVAGQLWAAGEITRLDELRLRATEGLLEAHLALGEHAAVVAAAEAAVAGYPLRERLWSQLMLALYRSGRQAEALAAYQRLRRHLDDELGLAPGPDVTALQSAILRQNPGLDAPARAAVLARAAPVLVPRELPSDVEGFTGREAELAELDYLLPVTAPPGRGVPHGPVVVSAVAGTAGVGKTALAVRWAHRVADSFPDGQLYVNLRGYDPGQPMTAAQALAGFLRSLGVQDAGIPLEEAERAARYRSLLAGKRVLVLLDNAATAEQVRSLLPGAPSVMVLVTSRDALAGLVARDGAHRLDLDVLPVADAATLLHSLIGARADADPAATLMLAGQCARLPLALRVAAELAVARPDMPLAGLVAELAREGERLALLDVGGDPRAAVASVFSWSYRHLPPDAARMFRLLGLHPGADWDRYAAAALADATAARAGQLLDSLARAHLIQPAGAGRYSLHDLLRAYAAGLAVSRDDDQARLAALTRLFDYYLAACAAAMDHLAPAERPRRPDPPPKPTPLPDLDDRETAVAWLDGEMATLTEVAAHTAGHGWPGHTIRLAATLWRYLCSGRHTEGITIHTHVLNAARDCGDRAAQAGALTSLGVHHYNQSRYEQAADCHQRALPIARATGDRLTQARALGNLALVFDVLGRDEAAFDSSRRALALFRELGDRHGEARALTDLGGRYLWRGRYKVAASHLGRALAQSREIGARDIEAYALHKLGEAYDHQGRYQQAADHQQQALAVGREIGYRTIEAFALTSLGHIRHRQGHYDQAAEHHQQALSLFRQIGFRSMEAEALNGAGETLLATGQPSQARDCHTKALDITRKIGHRGGQALALTRLADVCRQQGHLDQAAAYHQQSLALCREIGNRDGEADALNGAAETFLAAGQSGRAHACHAAAFSLARQTGNRREQARALAGLGAAFCRQGQHDQATEYHQQALTLYRDLGDLGGEADALNSAGETHLAAGQPDQALTCHAHALTLARQTGARYQEARAQHGLAGAADATGDLSQARQHRLQALDLYASLGIPGPTRTPASQPGPASAT
jgi:tetratricopeptide (TPR) repeat protein